MSKITEQEIRDHVEEFEDRLQQIDTLLDEIREKLQDTIEWNAFFMRPIVFGYLGKEIAKTYAAGSELGENSE